MKKFYRTFFVSLVVLFGFNNVKATHVAGADITYECLGNDQYVVTLNVFRDCFGTTLGTTANVDFVSDCGDVFNVDLPSVSVDEVSQLCPSALPNSDCGSGGFPGMEHHVYQDTITISPPCDNWTISWELCCRNAQIDNLSNPDTYSLYVESEMYSQTDTCNNSPYFTAQPIPYVCVNQQVTYNFGVVEVDGDSLEFVLIDALDGAGVTIPYNGGFSATSPTPFAAAPDALNLDPGTGLLTFTPNVTGVYVITIQVIEYDDNGDILSTIMRDIQVVVENCVNDVPPPTEGVIANLSGTVTQIDDYTIELCDGNSFSFDIEVADSNSTDSVTLSSNVELVFPGATFTTNGGNPATATISWTAVGGNSFFNSFVIYANDNACPVPGIQTYVYTVLINQSTVASEDVVVVCGQQIANLSVTGGDAFTWTALPGGDPINIGTNFGCDTCDVTWADPDSTTYYEVVSDLTTIGCTNKDTVKVEVVAEFGYSMAQPDTFVCLYGDADFIVTPDTAGTFYYDWSPAVFFGPGDTVGTVEGIISYPDTSDVVFVVTSDWGCVKTDTFQVVASENVQPVMSIVGDTTICIGDSTQLQAVNAVSYDCDYTLEMFDSFGDGWNGALFEVYINGSLDTSLTMLQPSVETATFPVVSGDSIEIVFTSGVFPTEESYILYDGTGTIVLQDGQSGTGPANGSVYTGVVNCGVNGGAIVYSWTPSAWVSQDGITDPYAIPQNDTTYTVVALDTIGGCSDTASINVYLVPTFANTLTQTDSAICLLDSVQFSVTPDVADTYTYQWSPANIFDDDTISNPMGGFSISGNNMPTVSITNSFGCTKVETFVVTVSQNVTPLLVVDGDTTICIGDSSQVFANVVNQGVGISDDFEGGATLSNWQSITNGSASASCGTNNGTDALYFDGAGNREATTIPLNVQNGGTVEFCMFVGNDLFSLTNCDNAETADEVFVEYSTNGGATWNQLVALSQADWDAAGSTPDAWQCYSVPIPVGAQSNATIFMWSQPNNSGSGFDNWAIDDVVITPIGGNYLYSWWPGSGLNDTTLADPWAFPVQDTSTFYVMAYDTIGGCSDIDSVNVYLVDSFSFQTYISDTAICLYEQFEMSVTPPNDTTYTYTWFNTDYLSSSSDSAVIADTVATSGWLTYVIEVANPVGCEVLDSFMIQVSEGAQPIITVAGDSTLCEGDTTTLFTVFNPSSPVACTYCIDMYDSFTDGWNGAYLQLWLDDTLAQDSLFSEAPWGGGAFGQFCIDIPEGTEIELVFNSGFFDDECSYYLINGSDTLFSDGTNATSPQVGTSFTGLANCGSIASPTLTYDWSPSSTLTSTNSSTTNAFPPADETYTVIVVDSIGGCSDTASYNVLVVPNFVPTAYASDSAICMLEDVDFNISVTPTPTTTYSYDWELSPFLTSTSGENVSAVSVSDCGDVTFNYTVSSPEGCEKEGVASVFVSTGIQPNIIATDDTICEGESVALNPSVGSINTNSDSCSLTIYIHDTFGDGWNGANMQLIINGDTTTIGFVGGAFPNGSDTVATVDIGICDGLELIYTNGVFPTEESYYIYDPYGNLLFQGGDSLTFTAPTAGSVWTASNLCGLSGVTYTYDWFPGGSLNVDDELNVIASPAATTQYELIVTDTVGFCADTAQINVEVVPIPEPQVTSPGVFCEDGDTAYIQVDITGGTWSGSGIVDPVNGGFYPGSAMVGNNTVNYTVSIAGCTGDTTFNIPVNVVPGNPTVFLGGPYCAATQINGISGSGSGGTLTWYEYDQTTAIDTGLIPTLGMATETDTFYVNETLNGCVGPFSSVPFIVIPQPQVSFSATPEQGYIPFDVVINNTSDDSLTYVWDFGNGTSSTDEDPAAVTYNQTGDFVIIVTGTDSIGCTNTDSLVIDADDIAYIPIVFSPNGDGTNDVFRVTGFPDDEFECIIYNRWGLKVYEYFDPAGEWDGENHPDGTYFVVINYNDWAGQPQNYSGYITKVSH